MVNGTTGPRGRATLRNSPGPMFTAEIVQRSPNGAGERLLVHAEHEVTAGDAEQRVSVVEEDGRGSIIAAPAASLSK